MAMGLTGQGPAASPQRLSSDDEVYALDRDDVVLDLAHDAVDADP
jgi:hypothetical protein